MKPTITIQICIVASDSTKAACDTNIFNIHNQISC